MDRKECELICEWQIDQRLYWRIKTKLAIIAASIIVVLVGLLSGCGQNGRQDKMYRIGIVNPTPTVDAAIEAFKECLAKEGFAEGKQVSYIYDGYKSTPAEIKSAVDHLVKQKVDLLFTINSPPALAAKEATKNTGIPVLFAVVSAPVRGGLVKSIRQPEGNVTGVRVGNSVPDTLEWFTKIVPSARRVYAPYYPKSINMKLKLESLKQKAQSLGIEVIAREVTNREEVLSALKQLPPDIQCIVELTSGWWGPYVNDFIDASLNNKIPLLGGNLRWVKAGALLSYNFDFGATGNQAGRMAAKILQGVSPGDLPVESSENHLYINLKIAEDMGIAVPPAIIKAAQTVIR